MRYNYFEDIIYYVSFGNSNNYSDLLVLVKRNTITEFFVFEGLWSIHLVEDFRTQ